MTQLNNKRFNDFKSANNFLSVFEEYEYHISKIEEIFKNSQGIEHEIQSAHLSKLLNISNLAKHKYFNVDIISEKSESSRDKNLETKTSSACSDKDHKKIPLNVRLSTDSNDTSAPVKLLVNIPNTMLDYLKETCKDHVNDSSSINSKKKFHIPRKRRLMSLFLKFFKKKKNKNLTYSSSNNNSLSSKEVNDIQNFPENSNQSSLEDTFAHNLENININKQEYKNADMALFDSDTASIVSSNTSLGESIVFPVDCHINDKVYVKIQPNLIIEHQVACSKNQEGKTIKYNTDPCTSSLEMQIEGEIPLHHKKRVPNDSVNQTPTPKIFKTNSCQGHQSMFIDKKKICDSEERVKLKEFLLDLLVGALSANSTYHKSSRKHCSCTLDLNSNSCIRSALDKCEDNSALDILLQHIVKDSEKNMDESPERNLQNLLKRQSSKVSICSSNESLSSIGETVIETKSSQDLFQNKSEQIKNLSMRNCNKKGYTQTERKDYYSSFDLNSNSTSSNIRDNCSTTIERGRNYMKNPGEIITKGRGSKSLERGYALVQRWDPINDKSCPMLFTKSSSKT